MPSTAFKRIPLKFPNIFIITHHYIRTFFKALNVNLYNCMLKHSYKKPVTHVWWPEMHLCISLKARKKKKKICTCSYILMSCFSPHLFLFLLATTGQHTSATCPRLRESRTWTQQVWVNYTGEGGGLLISHSERAGWSRGGHLNLWIRSTWLHIKTRSSK